MVAKKKLFGLAVVLGAIAGGVIALVRASSRTVVVVEPEIAASTRSAPASGAHDPAPSREARAVWEGGRADEVKVRGEQRKFSNSTVQPSTSNLPPVKVRKLIVNDPKIPKARQVLLANRRIAVEKGRSFPKKFCAAQTPTSRGTAPYVVISELPVSRDVRIQAVADGARVVGFLPNNALLVEADQAALKNLEEDVLFLAAVEYEPTDKIQRALLEKGERVEGRGERVEMVEATVVLLNPKDREVIQKFVTENGGTLLSGAPSEKSVSATIPQKLIEQLAGKAEVKWIERYARLKTLNDVVVQPGLMNVTPVRESPLGLTGAGQIITTSDSGIDTGNTKTMIPDIEHNLLGFARANTWVWKWGRRPYMGDETDVQGHGTHTAGSIVGDGTRSSGQFKGAAYGAKLWAWFCGNGGGILPPLDSSGSWYDFSRTFRPQGIDAHIHSASWGNDEALSKYDEMCVTVDEDIWNHPDFLPVFSAGNENKSSPLLPKTVTPPATSKNVLTVGASESVRPEAQYPSYADNPAQIASFSSCGPCADGRIKPDLVAPGTYVISTRSSQSTDTGWGVYNTYYLYNSGTSMATPLVAGTAALVREWLAKYRERANPSAALVKAILTGGATDLKSKSGNNVLKNVPDTRQGWGRVDLAESIAPTSGQGVFLADWLPFGAGSNFTFRVTTTNAAPLNAQLVWVDHPGEPGAGKALVNDLDLRMTANGATWLGNGGTEPDDLNNVESVRIRAAAAATYVVSVTCPAIPHDYREGGAAAIYIRGAFDPRRVKCGAAVGTVWTIL